MKQNFELLDARSAAKLMGLSKSTLAKMRMSGKGPAYHKLGRRVVYRLEDIETWVNSHRVNSTSEYHDE